MFSILKNRNATSTELAETYIQAKKLAEDLSTEKSEIHQKLMELQVDSFDKKPSRELQSLKVKMDNLNIRIEGCKFGREQLKNRLGEVLQKEAKQRQHQTGVKEVKLRPRISEHDYAFKLRNARKFLLAGDKVKFVVMFRGRERSHTEFGFELLNRVVEELNEIANVESRPQSEGRNLVMVSPQMAFIY